MAISSTVPEPSPENYDTEFRAYDDDAWYTVRLVREGSKLTVKYLDFPDDYDSVFLPESFRSREEIAGFTTRFRPVSAQVQDEDCSKVREFLHVCASHSFYGTDLRFYDAVVEEVKKEKHSVVNGEEECRCSFVLAWQHGPGVGSVAIKKIESICMAPTYTTILPEVASFVNIVMEKTMGMLDCVSPASAGGCDTGFSHTENCHPIVEKKPIGAQTLSQGERLSKLSVCKIQPSEEKNWQLDVTNGQEQDTDIGGISGQHMLLITNLERDLSSLTVMEFIHRHTSLVCQVFLYPSSPVEAYTYGVIFFECEKDLQKLSGFLNNPNHMVTSLRGRPWVIAQKLFGRKASQASPCTLLPSLDKSARSTSASRELKIVRAGTKEHEIAKKLQGIFNEFMAHQEGLHKRLALEEKKVLEQL